MRLFLPQNVEREEEATPPYLTDREEDVRLNLLRETTLHVKEGKQRLPTPEKNAIMELSTSFEKRRLGKQQQILSEMTQRCREQEVTDLSSRISAKCDLNLHHTRPVNGVPGRENPFYPSTTNTFRASNHRLSEVILTSPEMNNIPGLRSPRANTQKTYKFFPARRIMRQPTKIHVISTSLPKVNSLSNTKGGRHPGEAFIDSYRSPRYHNQSQADPALNRPRRISHPIASNSQAVAHRADPLAPLVLPRLSIVDPNYQDRIDSYFSSSRMPSIPRSKTFLDTASTSGRSYRSMVNFNNHTGKYNSNDTRMVRSDRSDLGFIQPQPHLGDEDSITSHGRGIGQSIEL